MKKILLGTTGLVGAALLASAASAETPKVTLGGFSDFQAGYTDDQKDNSLRKVGFRNDNEVTVKVDGKTDRGLGYGAEIDLEADTTADTDRQGLNASRTFTYLEGNFGRVELGGNKSVAATQRIDASTIAVATGGINGAFNYFVNATPATGAVAGTTNLGAANTGFISNSKLTSEHGSYTRVGDENTYNATKVSYYTPKFVGFQAGVSYTPKLEDRGQTMTRNDSGTSDVLDAGLTWEHTYGAYKLAASGTYEWAQGDTGFGIYNDDINEFNAGAMVGFGGFQVAGSYGKYFDSGVAGVDGYYWTAGLGYAAGPIGLSATFLQSELSNDNVVAGGKDSDFNNLVLGADYKLAPGLTPYAEVSFYDFNGAGTVASGTNYSNTGTSVILGTQVAF